MEKKYVIVVGDGMGDYPLEELNFRTPLEAAETPTLDLLAKKGEMGLTRTIPEGMSPGSDVANASILGYNPRNAITGRGPLEAAAMNIRLSEKDVAFRCNLVTLERNKEGKVFMKDYSAGHISTEEAHLIAKDLTKATEGLPLSFHPGISYRHVLVWHEGLEDIPTTPPHDIIGQPITSYGTVYEKNPVLKTFITRAEAILAHHPANALRLSKNLNPANSVWPWGQGRPPLIPTLAEKHNLTGVMISAVDLLKGLGFYAGFETPKIPGATGYLDTNYAGKVEAALEYLKKVDMAYIHIEGPDETSHEGNLSKKIQAIENFDSKVLSPLVKSLINAPWEVDLLIITDHLTPITVRTHVSDPVPFLMVRNLGRINLEDRNDDKGLNFCERSAKELQGENSIVFAWELFSYFLKKDMTLSGEKL